MAGQGTAGRILDKVVRVDRLHPHGFGRCRRQAHRSRNVQRQIKIEIGRQRSGRCRTAGHREGGVSDGLQEGDRNLGSEADIGSELNPGFCHGWRRARLHRETRIAGDGGHVAIEDVGGVGDAGRDGPVGRHQRRGDITRRFLRNRGDAGGVGRRLQLGLYPGGVRIVDRATDRRDQGDAGDREDHRDIAAPIPSETVDQAKSFVHGRMPVPVQTA